MCYPKHLGSLVCHKRHRYALFKEEVLHTEMFPVGHSISFASVWQLQ